MSLAALVGFICTFVGKYLFSIVGENMSLGVRQTLYSSILKKHLGWHDSREHSAGVLTNKLAKDVQLLNGVSTEAVAVVVEATFGLLWGVALGMYYDWRIALCALAITPFLMVGAVVNSKKQASGGFAVIDEEAQKESNLLAGDAIANFRTVASFAHSELIVSEFEAYLEAPQAAALKQAHFIGVLYGFSQFIQNVTFSTLFYFAALFLVKLPRENLSPLE